MTQKMALSIALFATLGMTACTVDAPTRADFNYSFLEELPDRSGVDDALKFKTPADSHITLSFRDSEDGAVAVDDDVSRVIVVIDEVQIASLDEEGDVHWHTISKTPFQVDLMKLAAGDIQEIADGPMPTGEYISVALGISDSYVVESSGGETKLQLPGNALLIKETFDLDPHGTTELVVGFGGLERLQYDDDGGWRTDPVVSLAVDYD